MILLEIKNKKNYPLEFIKTLKFILRRQFITEIDFTKLTSIEDLITVRYNKKIDLYNYCITAIETSIINEDNDKYVINVNPDTRIDGFRLATVISFINDGDIESTPYPIFSTIKTKTENDLPNLLTLYNFGVTI